MPGRRAKSPQTGKLTEQAARMASTGHLVSILVGAVAKLGGVLRRAAEQPGG